MKISIYVIRGSYDDIRLGHKFACSLARVGHEVTIVAKFAGPPTYIGAAVEKADAPFSSIIRVVLNMPFILRQAIRLQSDVYILSNPDAIPLAFALCLFGKRVIYDTAEDFSQRLQIRDYIPRQLRGVIGGFVTGLEKSLARRIALVTVTQPQQHQLLGGNSVMIENAPLIDGPIVEESSRILSRLPEPSVFTLIYIGGNTEYRGIYTMLNLLGRLNERMDCRLKIIGWFGDRDCEIRARDHDSWRFVDYQERLTHAETLAHLHRAHVGLALLQDVADHATTSVTKLYEYMWAGLPFVASDFDRWMQSVEGVSAGIFVNPNDTDRLVEAIMGLADDKTKTMAMAAAGRAHIQSTFNWTKTARQLVQAVDTAFDDRSGTTESPGRL